MPENYDYPLNLWDFIDETGSIITIASSNVSMDELNSILGTINIVANEDNYTLMVNGRNAGTISISSQISLKNVEYDSDTKKINFTFTTDEGDKTVSVDVSDLVDEYTAGDGLGLNANQFFLKIDPSSEKYLSVSENGVKVSGLDTLFNNLPSSISAEGNMKIVNIWLDHGPSVVRLVNFSIQFVVNSVPSNYQISLGRINSSYILNFNSLVRPNIMLSCSSNPDEYAILQFDYSTTYVGGTIQFLRNVTSGYRYTGHGTWITDG